MTGAAQNGRAERPRPPFGPRTTTFDLAWRKIEDEAIGAGKPWTPRNVARLYLLAERAAGDAKNDDALGELGDVSTARLERIAATRSRDFGDVAAKLAALIVENGQEEPVSGGGIEAAIHAGMCSCLADLVILGDRPLPDASVVLDMQADDFELRDMTEAEGAEFRGEGAAHTLDNSEGINGVDPVAPKRRHSEQIPDDVREPLAEARDFLDILAVMARADNGGEGLEGALVGRVVAQTAAAIEKAEAALAGAQPMPETAQ